METFDSGYISDDERVVDFVSCGGDLVLFSKSPRLNPRSGQNVVSLSKTLYPHDFIAYMYT